jgi:drug/metabolite transporter (DMT)-like permease
VTRRPLTHWLLLVALVAMWGSSFMFTKLAVDALPPAVVVAARLVIAAALLLALLAVRGEALPGAWRQWRWIVAMAIVGNAVPFWLISWGQQHIDSGLAGILMAIMPLSTLVLAHLFVEGERLTMRRAAGFLLGFAGIVVLIGPEALLEVRGSGSALVAQVAVLGGAICYAVNSILARRRPASPPRQAAAGVALAAGLMMAPIAFAGAPTAILTTPLPMLAVAAVLFLGVVSTAIATVVYFELVSAAGPSFLSLINYLIPIWAVGLGIAVLGERPSWSALAALVLVLTGIAVSGLAARHVPADRP